MCNRTLNCWHQITHRKICGIKGLYNVKFIMYLHTDEQISLLVPYTWGWFLGHCYAWWLLLWNRCWTRGSFCTRRSIDWCCRKLKNKVNVILLMERIWNENGRYWERGLHVSIFRVVVLVLKIWHSWYLWHCRNCIIDKNARIGKNVVLTNSAVSTISVT